MGFKKIYAEQLRSNGCCIVAYFSVNNWQGEPQ
jgi:hypothetical protein